MTKNTHITSNTNSKRDLCNTLGTYDTKNTHITLDTYDTKNTFNIMSTHDKKTLTSHQTQTAKGTCATHWAYMTQRAHTSHWTQTTRAIHYCMVLHVIAWYCMVLLGTWNLRHKIHLPHIQSNSTPVFFHFIRLHYSVFMFLLSKCSVSMFPMCVVCNLQINT